MAVKKVLCPWHSERTPSLAIYPEKLWYKCFGCGRTGHINELPDKELSELDVADFIPKPKENLEDTFEYLRSLPLQQHRGLWFPTDSSGFYIVWPDHSYYLKRFTNGTEPKYIGPSGHDRPIYRANTVRSNDLILVEGELNAASIGKCANANVISVGGTGNFTAKRLSKHLREFDRYGRIVILLDDDPAGAMAAIEARAYFKSLNKEVDICLLKRDMNWVLEHEGPEQVAIKVAECLRRSVA